MTTPAHPRLFTLPSLDLNLSCVTWARYRKERVNRHHQPCEEPTAVAYVHVPGGCIAIRGEEEVRQFRAAWVEWLGKQEGER